MIRYAHLDDHTLFIKGVRIGMQPFQQEIEEVFSANSEEECWEKLQRSPIDVLITDYNHDSTDISLFLQKVKSSFPQLKVLLLTIMQQETVQHLLDKGLADIYMPKSIDMEALKVSIIKIF